MTREEKIAAIAAAKAKMASGSAPSPAASVPSREEKIAAIKAAKEKPFVSMDDRPFQDRMVDLPNKIWDGIKEVPKAQWEAMKMMAHGAGTVLGYPGGLVRTAAAYGPNDAGGNKVTLEDLKQTLLGNAPSSDEYMKRAGVDEHNVNIPLIGPTSMRKAGGFAADMATDPLTYLGGEILGPAGHVAGDLMENAGQKLYSSGVKNLDLQGARYGKEPVSEVLMKNKVWGTSGRIQNQIDELADKILLDKKDILKKGAAAGAEVDMNAAVKRAQDHVNEMRKTANPDLVNSGAIDALQARIDRYKAAAGKAPEDITRTLPFTAEEQVMVPQHELPAYKTNETPLNHEFDLQGRTSIPEQATGTGYYTPTEAGARTRAMPMGTAPGAKNMHPDTASLDVINNAADEVIGLPRPMETKSVLVPKETTVFDQSDRVLGPSPVQTDKWKSSNNGSLPENIWQQLNTSGEGHGFDKALNGGLRDATQSSIEQSLGKDAAEQLAQKNDELGRLLTSQERAQLDAEIATRKNFITPVDTALAATSLPTAIAKKAGDLMKLPAIRTGGGLMLDGVGKTRIPDALARRILEDQTKDEQTPWLKMGGY